MEENTQQDGTSEEIKDPAAVLAALDRAKKDAKQFREEKEALEAKVAQYEQDNAKYSGKLLREKVVQELTKLNMVNTDRILKFVKFEAKQSVATAITVSPAPETSAIVLK